METFQLHKIISLKESSPLWRAEISLHARISTLATSHLLGCEYTLHMKRSIGVVATVIAIGIASWKIYDRRRPRVTDANPDTARSEIDPEDNPEPGAEEPATAQS